MDGWYYKFFAKMLLLHHTADELDWAFSEAGEPDLVILIDREPQEIWQRGRPFNHSELGLHQGYGNLGECSFVSYQQDVLSRLREMAARRSWIVFRARKGSTIVEDVEHIAEQIQKMVPPRP